MPHGQERAPAPSRDHHAPPSLQPPCPLSPPHPSPLTWAISHEALIIVSWVDPLLLIDLFADLSKPPCGLAVVSDVPSCQKTCSVLCWKDWTRWKQVNAKKTPVGRDKEASNTFFNFCKHFKYEKHGPSNLRKKKRCSKRFELNSLT